MELTAKISNDVGYIIANIMSAEKMAERLEVTPTTIYRWKDRKVSTIRADHARELNAMRLEHQGINESYPAVVTTPNNSRIKELFDSIGRLFKELSDIMPAACQLISDR